MTQNTELNYASMKNFETAKKSLSPRDILITVIRLPNIGWRWEYSAPGYSNSPLINSLTNGKSLPPPVSSSSWCSTSSCYQNSSGYAVGF